MAMVKRDEVYLINLDPTIGSEYKKPRPCLIVSPDSMNNGLNTVIVAPMTTVQRTYPTRVKLKFQNKKGDIALDQVRVIDKTRLIKKLGVIEKDTAQTVRTVLVEMFS